MAEMLLINPAHRPKRRRASSAKRRASPKRARRQSSVVMVAGPAPSRRRRNPIAMRAGRRVRRRRNPIGSANRGGSSIIGQLKSAMIGGAGAVGVELIMGQINPMLPASLQRQPNTVGVGDAVKAGVTIAIGSMLGKRMPILRQMAAGALTVQAAGIIRTMIPAAMPLGFASPARAVAGSQRVGPNAPRLAAYTNGRPPLLNAYVRSQSPLLNSAPGSARMREGVIYK